MAFNPQQHMTNLKGKDYLEVKWRLVWFREEHPSGRIDTDVQILTENAAIVKATVYDADGRALASGMATVRSAENARMSWAGREFEKAETAAIGRALAHAGFGTQFTNDDEGDYLADSPVDRKPSNVTSMTQDAPGIEFFEDDSDVQAGFTEAITHVGTKMSKNNKPYLVAGGVTLWSRDPFRELGYDDEVIDALANVGMLELPDAIIIEWQRDEKGYKVPVSIKRVKTGEIKPVAA